MIKGLLFSRFLMIPLIKMIQNYIIFPGFFRIIFFNDIAPLLLGEKSSTETSDSAVLRFTPRSIPNICAQ